MMLLNSHKKKTIRDVRLHIFIGHQPNFHRFSKACTFLNKLCIKSLVKVKKSFGQQRLDCKNPKV